MDAVSSVPEPVNEPVRSYAPGSADRTSLEAALKELGSAGPLDLTMTIGGDTQLAFFWFPGAPAREPGVSAPAALPGLGDITTAVSSMNHVAFDVAPEKIDEYARTLRKAGIEMLGPVNHDHSEQGWSMELHDGVFLRSVYFFDPDGIALEFAAWMRAIRPDDVRHEPRSAATV